MSADVQNDHIEYEDEEARVLAIERRLWATGCRLIGLTEQEAVSLIYTLVGITMLLTLLVLHLLLKSGKIPDRHRKAMFLGAMAIMTPFAAVYLLTWLLLAAALHLSSLQDAFTRSHRMTLKLLGYLSYLPALLILYIGYAIEFCLNLINLGKLLPKDEDMSEPVSDVEDGDDFDDVDGGGGANDGDRDDADDDNGDDALDDDGEDAQESTSFRPSSTRATVSSSSTRNRYLARDSSSAHNFSSRTRRIHHVGQRGNDSRHPAGVGSRRTRRSAVSNLDGTVSRRRPSNRGNTDDPGATTLAVATVAAAIVTTSILSSSHAPASTRQTTFSSIAAPSPDNSSYSYQGSSGYRPDSSSAVGSSLLQPFYPPAALSTISERRASHNDAPTGHEVLAPQVSFVNSGPIATSRTTPSALPMSGRSQPRVATTGPGSAWSAERFTADLRNPVLHVPQPGLDNRQRTSTPILRVRSDDDRGARRTFILPGPDRVDLATDRDSGPTARLPLQTAPEAGLGREANRPGPNRTDMATCGSAENPVDRCPMPSNSELAVRQQFQTINTWCELTQAPRPALDWRESQSAFSATSSVDRSRSLSPPNSQAEGGACEEPLEELTEAFAQQLQPHELHGAGAAAATTRAPPLHCQSVLQDSLDSSASCDPTVIQGDPSNVGDQLADPIATSMTPVASASMAHTTVFLPTTVVPTLTSSTISAGPLSTISATGVATSAAADAASALPSTAASTARRPVTRSTSRSEQLLPGLPLQKKK